MATLVLEDGSGLSNSNSYASVAEADAILDPQNNTTTWDALDDATKSNLLIWSTRLLDQHLRWTGTRATEDQALRWPRYGVYDRDGYQYDSDIVPQPVKDATAELARYLASEDRTVEDETRGYRRLKAGSVEMEIDRLDRTKVLPDSVLAIVGWLGEAVEQQGRFARLVRT
jgi:hypothetical protein